MPFISLSATSRPSRASRARYDDAHAPLAELGTNLEPLVTQVGDRSSPGKGGSDSLSWPAVEETSSTIDEPLQRPCAFSPRVGRCRLGSVSSCPGSRGKADRQ